MNPDTQELIQDEASGFYEAIQTILESIPLPWHTEDSLDKTSP